MNSYLEKSIRIKLLKMGNEPLEQKDFEKITELGLDNLTFSDKPKNIDISELGNFPNIESLTLQHFEISEKELETLQQLRKLTYLKLASCKLKSSKTYSFENLDTLAISNSSFKTLSSIRCPKNVSINGIDKVVDITSLEGIENVEQLRLTNIKRVVGIGVTNKMPNLKKLNLDGTTVDKQSIVDELKGRINVSQEEESRMIR